jgi:hypothetical protein
VYTPGATEPSGPGAIGDGASDRLAVEIDEHRAAGWASAGQHDVAGPVVIHGLNSEGNRRHRPRTRVRHLQGPARLGRDGLARNGDRQRAARLSRELALGHDDHHHTLGSDLRDVTRAFCDQGEFAGPRRHRARRQQYPLTARIGGGAPDLLLAVEHLHDGPRLGTAGDHRRAIRGDTHDVEARCNPTWGGRRR